MSSKKIDRIAALEREILSLRLDMETEDKLMHKWANEYSELVEEIPGCLPNGTGGFSPLGWVKWAKARLGYMSTREENPADASA